MNLSIVVDIRETALYEKLTERIANTPHDKITICTKPLHLGDIALEDSNGTTLVLYERKTLADLISSILDGRYAEQSHRLTHSSNIPTHNIVYIIEGMYSQLRKDTDKQMCISAMTTMSFFKGYSVFRTCSVFETAEFILGASRKIQKELSLGKQPYFVKKSGSDAVGEADPSLPANAGANPEEENSAKAYCEVVHKVKKDNITPENIGEILLCSIPGISSATAIELMKHYASFSVFMDELKHHPEKLEEIYLTTNGKKRKLGKNIIENLKRFLRRTDEGGP